MMYSQEEIKNINRLIHGLKYKLDKTTKLHLVPDGEKSIIHNGIRYSLEHLISSLEWALDVFNNLGKKKTNITFTNGYLLNFIGIDLISLAFLQYSKFEQENYDSIVIEILNFKESMI